MSVQRSLGAVADAAVSILDVEVPCHTPTASPAVLADPRAVASAHRVVPSDDRDAVTIFNAAPHVLVATAAVLIEVLVDRVAG